MKVADETAITEITIGPDGRIYVFGMSQEVLQVLAGLCPENDTLQARMACTSAVITRDDVAAELFTLGESYSTQHRQGGENER